MKIIISDTGKTEVEKLDFDIITLINKIINYVPKNDLVAIDHIVVKDVSNKKYYISENAGATYIPKNRGNPAHIEIYIKILYAHIKSSEIFKVMIPINEFGLAQTLFHEIGHHVRYLRSHGVKKMHSEKFANRYAGRLLNNYINENKQIINECFEKLKELADEGKLNVDIVNTMYKGWLRTCKKYVATN